MPSATSALAPSASTAQRHHGSRALDVLVRTAEDLSLASDAEHVRHVARRAARRLLGADGATFILREGDECHYVDEDAVAPLWKGQRFPIEACISGWSMLHGQQAIIEDVYADERILHSAYGPTFVNSLLMTPIRRHDPIGAIGMYWARRRRPTGQEAELARALADSTAVALQHVTALRELDRHRHLSITDPLTGLRNRRGWEMAVAGRLERAGARWSVAMVDLDDFKGFNDRFGHNAGDELLQTLTNAWLGALRPGDVMARLGGDEFGVLLADCGRREAGEVGERLRRVAEGRVTASVGVATGAPDADAAGLLACADAAMYAAKRGGRNRVAVLA